MCPLPIYYWPAKPTQCDSHDFWQIMGCMYEGVFFAGLGYTMTTAATPVPSVGMQNNVRNHINGGCNSTLCLQRRRKMVLWSNWRQSWHPHTVTWLNFSRCEIVCSNLRQVLWWEVSAPINMNILTKHGTPDLLISCVTSDLCSIMGPHACLLQ